jgi:hypothetical protein
MKTLISILMLGAISHSVYSQADSTDFYFKKGNTEKDARRFREAEKNFAKAAQFSPKDPKV